MKNLLFYLLFIFTVSLNSQNLSFEATGTPPDWFATDLNGTEHVLYSDYLDQGEIIVLEFMINNV
jgi:hypothetical protein